MASDWDRLLTYLGSDEPLEDDRYQWRLESRLAASDEWSETYRGARDHQGHAEDVAWGVISDARTGGELLEGRVYRITVWSGEMIVPTAESTGAVLTVRGGPYRG